MSAGVLNCLYVLGCLLAELFLGLILLGTNMLACGAQMLVGRAVRNKAGGKAVQIL